MEFRLGMRLTLIAITLVLSAGLKLAGAAPGDIFNLGTLNGASSNARAINDAGQVAGWPDTISGEFEGSHAFRYSGLPGAGAMADLGTLGGTDSIGWSINCAGQVTGYSQTTGDAAQHAFRYTGTPGAGGVMTDLGPGVGNSINDAGFVVGQSESRATLWQIDSANTAVDLDAWLDTTNPTFGAYWQLSVATGINNNGLITGLGYYDDGFGGLSDGFRAYVLDASSLVPEPTGLALFGLGLPVLFRRRARRAVQSFRSSRCKPGVCSASASVQSTRSATSHTGSRRPTSTATAA